MSTTKLIFCVRIINDYTNKHIRILKFKILHLYTFRNDKFLAIANYRPLSTIHIRTHDENCVCAYKQSERV